MERQSEGADPTARRRGEGTALVEVMNVVIALALVATCLSSTVVPVGEALLSGCPTSHIRSTRADLQSVRAAVTLYLQDHPQECPTLERLVDSGELGRTKRVTDAWDNPFVVACDRDGPIVFSRGPDAREGTEDDIQ